MGDSKETDGSARKTAGRLVRAVLLLVFSAGLLIGAYKCISIFVINRMAQNAYQQLSRDIFTDADFDETENETAKSAAGTEEPEGEDGNSSTISERVDFSVLQQINPEIKAWIRADEIGIDYPVMHTDNNTFYLNHLYDGTSNSNGALFIDCTNASPFHDRNTAIYGHNMQSGAMFHSLNRYTSQEFYEACPDMMLYTPEGNYRIELICGTLEDGNDAFIPFHFEDEDDFMEYIEKQKARSTFRSEVRIQPGDRLVSLCTCTSYSQDNRRYMLIGRLEELYADSSL